MAGTKGYGVALVEMIRSLGRWASKMAGAKGYGVVLVEMIKSLGRWARNMKNVLVVLALILLAACGGPCKPQVGPLDCSVMALDAGWAKVNTHTHTYLSDGNRSPEATIQWYKDNCYDAIAITDHNVFYNGLDYGLTILSGAEISVENHHHNFIEGVLDIHNHPQRKRESEIKTTLFEVFNGGSAYNIYVNENLWDKYLSKGKFLLGIAADDNHFTCDHKAGTGWIVARVDTVSKAGILNAIKAGDFYASTGVYLSEYSIEGAYIMTVDYVRTDASDCSFDLVQAGSFQRGKVTCMRSDFNLVTAWGQPVRYR